MPKKDEAQRTIEIPRQQVLAVVKPETADAEQRTVEVEFYTGAEVRRYNYRTDEEFLLSFGLDPENVRLDRANSGGPVLNTHREWDLSHVIGVIEEASVDWSVGKATLRMSEREELDGVWKDIAGGILRNVSMGAEIHRVEQLAVEDDDKLPRYRAVDWTLHEISFVPIGADPNAQTLSDADSRPPMDRVILTGAVPTTKEVPMDRKLARRLSDAIEKQVGEELTREGVLESLARRAGLTTAVVLTYLASEAKDAITKTSESVLEAFAIELALETKDLIEDAKSDGVEVALKKDLAAPPTPAPSGAQVLDMGEARAEMRRIAREERESATADERERSREILSRAKKAGLSIEFGQSLVEEGLSVDAAVARMLDERVRRDAEAPSHSGITLGLSEGEKVQDVMELALLHRYAPDKHELTGGAGDFRGMSLVELARWSAERAGQSTRGKSKMEIAGLALHSTSDFANVLANVANKSLRAAYDEKPQTWKPLARQQNAPDFKEISRVQLGEAPNLEKVNEHGEFKRGSIGEGAERYRLVTFGKVIGITRQVIVNDDLGAFTRVPAMFGAAGARLESDVVWSLILANAVMADGEALFSAAHGNLAGAGAGISVTTLDAGWSAISLQTGVDGKTLIDITPQYLVVPTELRVAAMREVGAMAKQRIVATKGADLPVFADDLTIISEPRLSKGVQGQAGSASRWYMAAGPGEVDGIEYAYLDGEDGMVVETREGFDVDGVEVKARLDFGAGILDHRGWYQNPGA